MPWSLATTRSPRTQGQRLFVLGGGATCPQVRRPCDKPGRGPRPRTWWDRKSAGPWQGQATEHADTALCPRWGGPQPTHAVHSEDLGPDEDEQGPQLPCGALQQLEHVGEDTHGQRLQGPGASGPGGRALGSPPSPGRPCSLSAAGRVPHCDLQVWDSVPPSPRVSCTQETDLCTETCVREGPRAWFLATNHLCGGTSLLPGRGLREKVASRDRWAEPRDANPVRSVLSWSQVCQDPKSGSQANGNAVPCPLLKATCVRTSLCLPGSGGRALSYGPSLCP